jgi:hypothetical protein
LVEFETKGNGEEEELISNRYEEGYCKVVIIKDVNNRYVSVEDSETGNGENVEEEIQRQAVDYM